MTNNEPNVKLPELPVWTYDYYIDNPNAAGLSSMNLADALCSYARAAIALNTPGVDAQEPAAYEGRTVWEGVEGNWHKITKDEYEYHKDKANAYQVRALYAHPAPTGVYAEKLNELVNKWRGNAKSHEIKAYREGQSDDIRNWHQGADEAFGDCANELSAALAALAEGNGE